MKTETDEVKNESKTTITNNEKRGGDDDGDDQENFVQAGEFGPEEKHIFERLECCLDRIQQRSVALKYLHENEAAYKERIQRYLNIGSKICIGLQGVFQSIDTFLTFNVGAPVLKFVFKPINLFLAFLLGILYGVEQLRSDEKQIVEHKYTAQQFAELNDQITEQLLLSQTLCKPDFLLREALMSYRTIFAQAPSIRTEKIEQYIQKIHATDLPSPFLDDDLKELEHVLRETRVLRRRRHLSIPI